MLYKEEVVIRKHAIRMVVLYGKTRSDQKRIWTNILSLTAARSRFLVVATHERTGQPHKEGYPGSSFL